MSTRPVVVFADVEPWEAFFQFAAALRRRGVVVERLTGADRSIVRRINDLLQRPIFRRIHAGIRLDEDGNVVTEHLPLHVLAAASAVEAVDLVAASLSASGELPVRTNVATSEQLLSDKLAMTRHALDHGLAAPLSWAAEEDHPLTPPFIVKPRLGSGGSGVVLVRDATTAAVVADEARSRPGRLMVQEWAPGELLHVAGVARRGELLQGATYRDVGAPRTPFGPPADVMTVDDPETMAQVSDLMVSLGYTGAFCLDYVRSAEGRALLVDFNARVFGSWAALQAAGMDFVGAYTYAWGLSSDRPTGGARAGVRLRVLPPDMSLAGTGSLVAILVQHLRDVTGSTRMLGGRWALSTSCRLFSAALVQAGRRGRRALSGHRSTNTAGPRA